MLRARHGHRRHRHGTPVVYLTDACSGSTQEYEDMATAMMEFASPTHTAVMTCEEYTALRQG